MKPLPTRGVPLLDAREAADLLGISMDRFQAFDEELDLIKPMSTPLGPRYREDELTRLAEAIAPASRYHIKLKPGEAARILRLTVPTLRRYAQEGRLHRDPAGLYDADEVHVLSRQRTEQRAARPPERAGT